MVNRFGVGVVETTNWLSSVAGEAMLRQSCFRAPNKTSFAQTAYALQTKSHRLRFVCELNGSWGLCWASVKLLKHGFVLQALGKTLLVPRQARAHEVMQTLVAKFVHLLHGFFRSPTLLSHAISRDHYSGAVIAQPAVHEDFLARIFSRDFYKPRETPHLWERDNTTVTRRRPCPDS